MQEKDISGLQELRHSNYSIVDEQPNIEGWSIYDGQHRKLGKVHDLLFDPATHQVRYIIASLHEKIAGNDSGHVLIPIGIAELHATDDEVILPSHIAAQTAEFSPYAFDPGNNDKGIAAAVGLAAGMATNDQFSDANFYRNRKDIKSNEQVIPIVEEQLKIDKTRVQTGGIRLRSRIVEQPIEQSIRLKDETVQVDHTPVDRVATEESFREEQLQAASYTEVPVINKDARVVEEIRVNKEVSERDDTISDTVRRTQVDVDHLTNMDRFPSSDSDNKR
ncbi:MAG: PRC and DUF2382 domain-containing protein [Chitinophagaceae bacterium]|nr:PRC and DUF2382 domain-containing protein [Chitinophagaceae bacterium]